jgi:hypothetical protein
MEKESPGKESMEEDHWGGLGLKRLLHQRRRRIYITTIEGCYEITIL